MCRSNRVWTSPAPGTRALVLVVFVAIAPGLLAAPARGQLAQEVPAEYVVDYPLATKFCPPVRTFFFDVEETIQRAGGRTIRHQPNGGYGLPIRQRVEGNNLIHLGADVGWYRVGEPVYCVADGVVRISQGPPTARGERKRAIPRGAMSWGNLIAIEHRLTNDLYVTTIYGHLGPDRQVQVGQIVEAGHQIGTIGKQSRNVNGGYKPHLHFGVRKGRFARISIVGYGLSTTDWHDPTEFLKERRANVDPAPFKPSRRATGL